MVSDFWGLGLNVGHRFKKKCSSDLNSLLLKVVGNEKGGGSGGWLLFEDAFGPWQLMSVYFLILPSSSPQRISVSCL